MKCDLSERFVFEKLQYKLDFRVCHSGEADDHDDNDDDGDTMITMIMTMAMMEFNGIRNYANAVKCE